MRDHCREGGGMVVAAAVAVIEQEKSSKEKYPFSIDNLLSPLNGTQKYDKKYWDRSSSTTSISVDEKDSGTISRLNVSGMGVANDIATRKLNISPSSLHVTSKNKFCLEEVAPGCNSEFRAASNSSNLLAKIVSSKTSKHQIDHFEEAVKDFNLTAEDVQNFMSEYNSLKTDLTKTEERQGCVVLHNQYVNGKREPPHSSSSDFVVFDIDSSDTDSSSVIESDSDEHDEHVMNEGLETITEEDRASSLQSHPDPPVEPRSVLGNSHIEGDPPLASSTLCRVRPVYGDICRGDISSPDDDSTVKGNDAAWSGSTSNRESTSDLSTCSSDRPKSLKDSSTRCDDDFQWIRKEPVKSTQKMEHQALPVAKPPINRSLREKSARRSSERSAPGSLDRRRHHNYQNRQERDQKSRSSHVLKSPPKFEDYVPQNCQSWCCNPHANESQYCYENFHRRHERVDPQRYGSNPMLMEQRFIERGSHPDIYGDCGNRFRHEQPYGCCSYHSAPPCCFFNDTRNFHWAPPNYPVNKGPDYDDKLHKLQTEKDNLQLQVQVLSEQIEAQTDKISDLEKSLNERKQQLVNSEDLLQREMLSRSSLETQKLELMSAISEMKLHQASLEREILELRVTRFNNNTPLGGNTKPPLRPKTSPQHSTPIHHNSNQALNMRMTPSPSPVSTGQSPRRTESFTSQDIQSPKTPPANYRRQIDIHYGSLPRQQFISNGEIVPIIDSNANPANGSKKGVAFAETEKIIIEDTTDGSPHSPSLTFSKNKGIKKIFGRMKRSGSGNLEDIPGLSEFQRGGVRATAAARLGWSEPQMNSKPEKPFAEWDAENICDWLQDLGLEQYITEAKRWVKNGQQLQEASIQEIEKELVIKNVLHRKKLQLAIIDTQENSCSDLFLAKAGKLDTAWVLRWLDDTGLPQHKESFLINRVDGRVLHRLTVDDLAVLHVTSLLHVASLRRGIQVLRDNDFDPSCLQRRSLPDDPEQPTIKNICLWTTHRVMEWLRAVDLAEYAPNLRGAGVHGGLMVLEEKFNAELLASLLNIPQCKTLLRRHLNTHFKELLGKETIQVKRESEATLGYVPLTPSAKLKVPKKSQFSLKRKKSKGEVDYGDLVCPLNPNSEGEMNGSVRGSLGVARIEELKEEAAFQHSDDTSLAGSCSQSPCVSPLPERHHP